MLIYNTTYHTETACCQEFIGWLRTEYIPTALQREELSEPRIARILSQEREAGVSISLQFNVADLDKLSRWYEACGSRLIEAMQQKFGQHVAGFSTIMEQIDL